MRTRHEHVVQVSVLLLGIVLVAWLHALGWFIGLGWLLPIIITTDLGISRQRSGWMWGLFLGWLGVLILACMRPLPKQIAQ